MCNCTDNKTRIINKKGAGIATVPTSPDHRDTSWLSTDIYEGEWYLDTDTGYAYTRNGGAIIPLFVGIPPLGTIGTVSSSPHGAGAYETILVDATGGNIKVDLPTAVGVAGLKFNIKKIDASSNTVLVDPNGAQTLDGLSDLTISAQYRSYTIISDGANWFNF